MKRKNELWMSESGERKPPEIESLSFGRAVIGIVPDICVLYIWPFLTSNWSIKRGVVVSIIGIGLSSIIPGLAIVADMFGMVLTIIIVVSVLKFVFGDFTFSVGEEDDVKNSEQEIPGSSQMQYGKLRRRFKRNRRLKRR